MSNYLAPKQVGLVLSVANFPAGVNAFPAFLPTASMESYRAVEFAQNTAGASTSLPAPVDATIIFGVDVINTGTASLTVSGAVIPAGSGVRYEWNGFGWTPMSVPTSALVAATYSSIASAASMAGTQQALTTTVQTNPKTLQPTSARIDIQTGATVSGTGLTASQYQVVATQAGTYSVQVGAYISGTGAAGTSAIQLVKNGTTVVADGQAFRPTANNPVRVSLAADVSLAAGDTLDFRLGDNVLTTINVSDFSVAVNQITGFLPYTAAAAYIQAGLSANAALGNAAGLTFPFNQVNGANGISLSNGVFTLPAGSTYVLRGAPQFLGGGSNVFQNFQWYNETAGAFVGVVGTAQVISGNTGPVNPYAEAIVTTAVSTNFSLRTLSGGIAGTYTASSSSAFIQAVSAQAGIADLVGATVAAAGVHGLVPAPAATTTLDQTLHGDGTWDITNRHASTGLGDFTANTANAPGTYDAYDALTFQQATAGITFGLPTPAKTGQRQMILYHGGTAALTITASTNTFTMNPGDVVTLEYVSNAKWVIVSKSSSGAGVKLYALTSAYAAGDVVSYQGGLLITANAAIPANTAFAWGTTGATWAPFDTNTLNFRGAWVTTNAYAAGDLVAYQNGKLYFTANAIAAGGVAPTLAGSGWSTFDFYTREPMIGASATGNGFQGSVPGPIAGQQGFFLQGDGTWATPPVAKLTASATQTFTTGVSATVNLPTIAFATGVTTSTANTLTVVTAGKYRITGHVNFAANAVGGRISQIFKNGAVLQGAAIGNAGGTFGTDVIYQGVHQLAAGDQITLQGNQASGANLSTLFTAGSVYSELSIEYVGP